MQELVKEVFSPAKFLGGADLDNESGNYLCDRNQEKQAKSPLQT